jgi:uncharacterized protein YjbI with pentapeptide repeats
MSEVSEGRSAVGQKEKEPLPQVPILASLPPAPPGVYPVHLTLTTGDYCGRKLFGEGGRCYWHSESLEKYQSEAMAGYFGSGSTLKKAIEEEIDAGRSLEAVYLVKASLGGNLLWRGCNLRGAKLVRANLKDAHLSYSDLKGADFRGANLENAYLSDCNITGARFFGARLFNTKFRSNDFAGVTGLSKERFKGLRWGWFPIYRMLEEYPQQCEGVYRSLMAYFSSRGLFDDASWAAYKSLVMRHRLLSQRLSRSKLWGEELALAMFNDAGRATELLQIMPGISPKKVSIRFVVARAAALFEWTKSFVLRVVVGYGEKPLRVLWNALSAILLYAMIYQKIGAINDKSFVSCLYFSAITFTTVGYGDLAPHGAFRLLAASEALVGVLLCGLFLFCLTRRSVGRA